MQIIASHINTDFDALASMLAAKKLYPDAQIVISSRQHMNVKRFLNIYRDTFDCVKDHEIDWSKVKELILVDVSTLNRVSPFVRDVNVEDINIVIYDHHESKEEIVENFEGKIERVGATVTILIEEIQKRNLSITSFEATLFGLGIYTDTGFFSFNHTTARDLKAASFLMEQGMNLEIVEKFSEQRLEPEQQYMLDKLFKDATTYERDGLQITLSTAEFDNVHSGLAIVAEKLLHIRGTDAALAIVRMKNHVIVVGRANSERINFIPFLKYLGGGGHKNAGSATIKNVELEEVFQKVTEKIDVMITPATIAKQIMTSPVKTISPDTTIEEAGILMYRYQHSGYPVVENGSILGVITRRDLDKALHHGLGHAPVKAYMSTEVITSTPYATLEEVQNLIIDYNIGRLPIVEKDEIVGIISRTDLIKALHAEALLEDFGEVPNNHIRNNIQVEMKQQLEDDLFSLLQKVGKIADKMKIKAYLIGGIVRDVLLHVPNDDIDIVIEGDGISFVKKLMETYGGDAIVHENFGTATWIHPSKIEIDIASSRLEYYERPASLPNVEKSTLQEDLYRRDFTINAMAVCLNEEEFGFLVDPFAGRLDIFNKRVRVLHNLSFVEDPTRIFRAIRFELRYDFKMDQQTEQLVLHSVQQVKDLSIDRMIAEVRRLFEEHYPTLVIRRLFELNFWEQYGVSKRKIPEIINHTNRMNKLFKEGKKFGLSTSKPPWFLNFMLPLFYQKDEQTANTFALTKQDKKFVKEIFSLKRKLSFEKQSIEKYHSILHRHSEEAILFFIASQKEETTYSLLDYLKKRAEMISFIDGKDLKKLGFKPGPRFSEIFLQLEKAQLKGEITNKHEAIAWIKTTFNVM